jgi:MFS family permease
VTASRPWLTRNLKVASGVSFLQDTASELLYPLLPFFLTGVLGAPVVAVGLVEGVADGAAAAARVATGRLADRMRRRPLVGLGYGLAAAGKLLIAAAAVWPVVLAGRFVDRIGKGVRGTPRDALIVVDIPADLRGRAFGFHRAMDTAGAVLGPLLGLAGYLLLDGRIRPLLWIAVVPAVLSTLLVLALREPPRPPEPSQSPRSPAAGIPAANPGPPVAARQGRLPARYWWVTGMLTAFSLVNFPDALLLLRLHQIGFAITAVILAYVGYNAVYTLLSYPAGALSDRLPKARVFALGLVCFAVGYIGLGLTHSQPVAWVLLAAYGGFAACTDAVGKAWISGLAPAGLQGTAQGIFQGMTGAGVLVAGIWAGLAWHGDGTLPLLISGGVAAAIAVLLALTGRSPQRSSI